MDRENLTPESVTSEYQSGIGFNQGIELYDCVETNENFFIGRQWENVQANGAPTPVFNFLKRVVLFAVANASTDNWKLNAHTLPGYMGNVADGEFLADVLNDEFTAIFEQNNLGSLLRRFARNAAVDGDGCTYTYWDPDAETGQWSKGAIRTELLQNTQVLFGNPNVDDVQSQPYIIIERRMMVQEAKKRANAFGGEPDEIQADTKETGGSNKMDSLGGNKVTVLLQMWRDDDTGTIWGYECTSTAVVRPAWDMRIKRYPITWMPWDYVQDCYHGQAMITGLIPNQIFVNKLFALTMISLTTTAYPKTLFDRTKVQHWSNRVGSAIAVSGPIENVAKIIDPAPVSPQISQFIELAVSFTQKFLGASDIALGDTRPDNAAAIIALQRAAAVPTELTRQSLMQSIEDLGRIYMDFMGTYYGQRFAFITDERTNQRIPVPVDYNLLREIPMAIKLDVGASSYWSEIASMHTLDNLLMQGKISTKEYLKRLPAGHITDKEALIQVLEEEERMQKMAAGLPVDMPAAPQEAAPASVEAGPMANPEPPLEGGSGNRALQRELTKMGQLPRMEG